MPTPTTLAAAFAMVLGAGALAQPVHLSLHQDFEANADGFDLFREGSLTRTLGTPGFQAAGGNAYGTAHLNSSDDTTPGGGGGSGFRRFFPFDGTLPALPPEVRALEVRESYKFFIHPDAGAVGDRWFATGTDISQRGFWFQKSGAQQWSAGVNFGSSGLDVIFAEGATLDVGGWYSFSKVMTNLDDVNTQISYEILDPAGDLVLSRTQQVTDASLLFFNWVVGWSAGGDQFVQVDDISFELDAEQVVLVPLPSAAMLGLAGLSVGALHRRRR